MRVAAGTAIPGTVDYYVPLDGESQEAIERNIGPVLTASAIAFAGAEIADAIRTGLSQIAEAIESRDD